MTHPDPVGQRFKIDLSEGGVYIFGLFFRQKSFLFERWKEVDRFDSREKAMARYELIKDLPEYLP